LQGAKSIPKQKFGASKFHSNLAPKGPTWQPWGHKSSLLTLWEPAYDIFVPRF